MPNLFKNLTGFFFKTLDNKKICTMVCRIRIVFPKTNATAKIKSTNNSILLIYIDFFKSAEN